VASRVQTAVTMRQVTGSMMNVVKGMDQAMKAMDLEKVSLMSFPPPPYNIGSMPLLQSVFRSSYELDRPAHAPRSPP
jgi:hypothetical protein